MIKKGELISLNLSLRSYLHGVLLLHIHDTLREKQPVHEEKHFFILQEVIHYLFLITLCKLERLYVIHFQVELVEYGLVLEVIWHVMWSLGILAESDTLYRL